MNKLSRSPFFWALIIAGALVGSALVSDADDSWAEFVAWAAFFVALNTPLLFAPAGSNRFCAAWLTRERKEP